MSTNGKSKRGFASMDPAKRRLVSSLGGKAAHAAGTGHEFTPAEARRAGRLGGRPTPAKPQPPRPPRPVATCRQCDALGGTRGLCDRCYARCLYQVRVGKTTWTALEAAGLALPLVEQIGEGG
jgi:hypothetical protein